MRGSQFSAGLDLKTTDDVVVKVGEITQIKTGVMLGAGARDGNYVVVPIGYFGLIKERSSVAKRGVICVAGVIDADYLDREIIILVTALVDPVVFKAGDRVAQLLVLPCLLDVPLVDRGGGFGSTGV